MPKIQQLTEDQVQYQVIEYLELLQNQGKVILFSHVPSSTFTKSWSVKARNKRLGVRPGVPDLIIVLPYKVLFLELKREKGGVLSEHQKNWISSLEQVSGNVFVSVAKGFDEAKTAIDKLV